MSENERIEGELLIKRLQAELRTEEMRLVLLKKIRQTQLLAAQHQQQQQITLTATANIQDIKSGTKTTFIDHFQLTELAKSLIFY